MNKSVYYLNAIINTLILIERIRNTVIISHTVVCVRCVTISKIAL